MYLDTSILVKLLTSEPDSAWFEQNIQGHALVTSELTLVEVKSALCAKERAGVITKRHRSDSEDKLDEMQDSEIIRIVDLDNRVVRKARHVIETCQPKIPLRALDALHVASCDIAQDFPLCTTDQRMHDAARALNIPVFPKTLPLNA